MSNHVRYTVQQVCDILDVELPDEYSELANNTLTCIAPGPNSLSPGGGFILSGKNLEDRENKLRRAMNQKPQVVFAGRASRKVSDLQNVPHVFIKDPYDSIVRLSRAMREELGTKVVGVTGSLGKTSTKELLYSVLRQEYQTSKSRGNRNSTSGVFLSVQNIEKNTQFHVQEYSVSISGKTMESKIAACVPNAAVVTNISDPHIEILGSRENILREKIKLASEMAPGSPAFLNYDDELLKEVKLENQRIISYAVHNKEADYYAEDIEVLDGFMKFTIVHAGRRTPVTMNVVGIHNIGNAVVAMAVGEWAGVPQDKIVKGIAEFKTEGIRQTLTDIGGYSLYLDSYNAAPVSMVGAVHTLEQIPVKDGGKRIAVVAEMLELGERSPLLHTEVGEKIGQSNVDLVICFGAANAQRIAEAIRKADKAVLYTDDRTELNKWMSQLITRKDIALFKGSHALLLHKSVDQVFGTSFHFKDDYYIDEDGAFSYKVVRASEKKQQVVAVAGYAGEENVVAIPKEYDGLTVSSVGQKSFYKNHALTRVDIPAGINNIAQEAFRNCRRLKKVTLPKTLKLIEEGAFYGCKALEEVVIPEGVIEIAEEAFANCSALKRVVLPSTLGRIGEGAFAGCADAKFECAEGSYAEKYIAESK